MGYSSDAGNGPFGFGWTLSLPSLDRKTNKSLPRYEDSGGGTDVYGFAGGEDLVPAMLTRGGRLVPDQDEDREWRGQRYRVRRYRPRIEGSVNRIERWERKTDGDVFWRQVSGGNVVSCFGISSESRITDPSDPTRVFRWLISYSHDDKGNAVVYDYASENSDAVDATHLHERNRTAAARTANRYLKRVRYGNRAPCGPEERPNDRDDWLFELVFDYGEGHYTQEPADPEGREFVRARSALGSDASWPVRRDPFSTYRAGFELRTYRLCRRVLMFHHFPEEAGVGVACLVRSTAFSYDESMTGAFLLSAKQSGYRRLSGDRYLRRSLPSLTFEFSKTPLQEGDDASGLTVRAIEDRDSLEGMAAGLDNGVNRVVDLHGEGISGILSEHPGGWTYKPNLGGGRFGRRRKVAERPAMAALGAGGQRFVDIAGNGRLDLVEMRLPTPGFHEASGESGWAPFRPFPSWPNIDWRNENLRFIDLTGDGHADILIAGDGAFTWYPSVARDGFDAGRRVAQMLDEERGPRLVFADGTDSIYLADMSGDGLTDLVRIRNGEVSYWPNLGHGRFGAKVGMDDAPWFDLPGRFEQRRIRLADIDGTGPADILYLGADGVRVYWNQSGNAWRRGATIRGLPRLDDVASIQVVDFLGTGTACLVWSSPMPGQADRPVRYVDLMGGVKPNLLLRTVNNLGMETAIHYAPSTRFYLADKASGRPWATRLPFPVNVVERVHTRDHVGRNRFVSRYAYHHGCFDATEREFRGFGMVERWDTEEIGALNAEGELSVTRDMEIASHVPPVLTRSWYHTGAWHDGEDISRRYEQEYYRPPTADEGAALLPGTALPPGSDAYAGRDAARALKGSELRVEVYAADGSAQSRDPYLVTERNYAIEVVQPASDDSPGVYHVHERETLTLTYERNPADPRITHRFLLEVDDYGNALRTASVSYGRRLADPDLDPDDRTQQHRVHVTCAESAYTNAVVTDDAYRVPLPCDSRIYELYNVRPGKVFFDFDEIATRLNEAADGRHDLSHEDVRGTGISSGHPFRRLVERVVALYRRDDLSGALPLGRLDPRAILYESYELALAPAQLALIFGARVNDAMLEEGGHQRLFGEPGWWIPSGRSCLSPGDGDSPAEELGHARGHFFMPHRIIDPFGGTARVSYDRYDLSAVETVDPAGNRVTAEIDYRVLQPALVTDPNGNRRAAVFDALGLVAGTAVMGKAGEREGDSLTDFRPDLSPAETDSFLAAPTPDAARAVLGRASTRVIYDTHRYARRGAGAVAPAVAVTIARATHAADTAPSSPTEVKIDLAYSDGSGRAIQTKSLAEPGPLEPGGAVADLRWVTSGWTIFNNKGNPIRSYEPFFDADHEFRFGHAVGVGPLQFYDPLGRQIGTLHPDHRWEKAVFGPWRREDWDANDTLSLRPEEDEHLGGHFRRLPRSEYSPTWIERRFDGALGADEREAAHRAVLHGGTPAVSHYDTQGRPFLTVAHNRFEREGTIVDEFAMSRIEADLKGNPIAIRDPRNNTVMVYGVVARDRSGAVVRGDHGVPVLDACGFDYAKRSLATWSMDSGERRILPDIRGEALYVWDVNDGPAAAGGLAVEERVLHTALDSMRRPLERRMRVNDGSWRTLERFEYGESHPDARARNLRGQLYQHFHAGGLSASERFDFKGNLLEARRRFPVDRDVPHLDWSAGAAEDLLADESFVQHRECDALNRVVRHSDWHRGSERITVHEARFNRRGLPAEQSVTIGASRMAGGDARGSRIVVFAEADYDAAGRLRRERFGNGTTSRYDYDPLSQRLAQIRTTVPGVDPGFPAYRAGLSDPSVVQQLHYVHDPAGNILSVQDDAYQPVFFANQNVEARTRYRYDALYRLIEATGRESAAATAPPGRFEEPVSYVTFPAAEGTLRNYTQRYAYDLAGNMVEMRHSAGSGARGGSWHQHFAYAAGSNRLARSWIGAGDAEAVRYRYDQRGNMLNLANAPTGRELHWNHRDMIETIDLQGGGWAHYGYGPDRQRAWKHIARRDGTVEERLYLGGTELYRRWRGDRLVEEIETHHVSAGERRLLIVDDVLLTDNASLGTGILSRYQYGNHLGSATLELNDAARVISYEEYHPYGTAAFRASGRDVRATAKRYRYTGMERDDESGLAYHGARYYAPWLARWCSTDPTGIEDGLNVYAYAHARPTVGVDRTGTAIVIVVVAAVIAVLVVADVASDDPARQRDDGELLLETAGMAAVGTGSGLITEGVTLRLSGGAANTFLRSLYANAAGGAAGGGFMGFGETALHDALEGEMSSLEVYVFNTGAAAAGGGVLGGGLSPLEFLGRRLAPEARRALPEWLRRLSSRGAAGEGTAAVGESAEAFEETVQRMMRQAADLEAGEDIITDQRTVRTLAQQIYERSPFLRRLVEIRSLEGPELDLALQQLIVDFEQASGVRVEFVAEGAVQAASHSPGNLASLGTRPGWLQIERQVLDDSQLLLTELTHEITAYAVFRVFGGYGSNIPAFLTGYEAVNPSGGALNIALEDLVRELARGR